ncbi:MAG TPA: peptidylprolyl isomerase [Acidimicrobiales bacterium]|nr:peptidylprolyl isomerase [Acidimicrobiales bacterium]
MRRLLALVAVATGASLGVAACNPVQPYAALVNGHAVTQHDLNTELEGIASSPQYMNALEQNGGGSIFGQVKGGRTFDPQFADAVLRQEVFFELLRQEMVARHLTVTNDDLAAAKQDANSLLGAAVLKSMPADYRDVLIRRTAEQTVLEADLTHTDVSPSAVSAYYAAHRDTFVNVCLQNIVVPTQTGAQQVEAALAKGQSFAVLAQQLSTDQNSAQSGGQLGCGPAVNLPAPYDQAVRTQAVGVVGPPVQGQGGWYVIEVTARQPMSPSAAGPDIRKAILADGNNALNAWLESALRKAHITVDPRYGRFTATGPGGVAGVVPATPPNPRTDDPTTTTAPSSAPASPTG